MVNNGADKLRGALDIFPRRCITLGMRQLMKAEVFKVCLYCSWQWGIMRKCLLTKTTRFAPCDLPPEPQKRRGRRYARALQFHALTPIFYIIRLNFSGIHAII